ncbi:MAG: hypothetical protein NC299_09015 [Lachnospiraceae bacterium]|nr:hypothetical protein [Lachnospiraceae bacterium]
MSDFIKREKVYEMLHSIGGCGAKPESWADGWDKAIDTAISELNDIPAADVRRERHAHWKHRQIFRQRYVKCSNCGVSIPFGNAWNYCTNCGAKMDGKGSDDVKP